MPGLKLIVVRDPDEAEAAEIYVDGAVDGRAYRFLLDTGAAKTSVIADDYTATFEPVGTDDSSGVFTPTRADLITVPSISVGPVARQNFTLARAAAAGPGVKNLIGMDLLKDFCCHFFFDDSRVVVGDGGHDQRHAFQPLLLDQRFHPYLDVEFGDTRASAVWDTGASLTVVDAGFVSRQPAFFAAAGRSTGTDAAGTQVETPLLVMSGAVIGGRAFSPHKVAAVDLSQVNAGIEVPMDMILGYSTLRQANWLLDFPRRRWALSK